MQVSPSTDKLLHDKLPIDNNEKILNVYRHHWFAYVASWMIGVVVSILILGVAAALSAYGGSDSTIVDHRAQILAVAGGFSILILAGAAIPAYLRSQEQMVLTEEAVIQMLQPSLFASKVDQLGLQHVTDVSVRQDMLGTILGYGHISIETPGEQDNYEFYIVPNPQQVAREISQAHENFTAALMGGRLPSTFGSSTMGGTNQAQLTIDPQQYQQFLAYQQMVAKQQQDQQSQANDPTNNGQPPVA